MSFLQYYMFNTFYDLEAIILTCQVRLSDRVNTHVVRKLNIIASVWLGELWIAGNYYQVSVALLFQPSLRHLFLFLSHCKWKIACCSGSHVLSCLGLHG